MSDLQMREILARLDAQEAELTALRAARQRPKLRMPGGRRGRLLAITIAVLLVAAVPLSIYAANPFTDLTGSVHDTNIDTIYNLGITTGCNPPDLDNYCPTDNVTRQEMASFLARTAALNRIAYASHPSAGTSDNLGSGPSKAYMTVDLTVPGRAGGAKLLVRVLFTGYVFSRSGPSDCPCTLRGEITANGETAGGATPVDAQVVTRATIGAAALTADETANFSGSRVFLLDPGTYTFTMTVTRETGTYTSVGFGYGNMQAEPIAFDGTGTLAVTPGSSPSPSPSASPSPSPSASPSPSPSPSPSASPSGSVGAQN